MKTEAEIRAELKLMKAIIEDMQKHGRKAYTQSGTAHALEWVLGEAVEKNMPPSELHAQIEWLVERAEKYCRLRALCTADQIGAGQHVTFDEGLLDRVDKVATSIGETRSGFFAKAARARMMSAALDTFDAEVSELEQPERKRA